MTKIKARLKTWTGDNHIDLDGYAIELTDQHGNRYEISLTEKEPDCIEIMLIGTVHIGRLAVIPQASNVVQVTTVPR